MFNLLFSHDFYISTTFLLLYTSFPPVAEYGQGSMHGDLREGTLVLPGFLGGNPGVLVPLLEYLSVGFFSCNTSGVVHHDVFFHSLFLLHLDCRVEYVALATSCWGCRRPANQKINLFSISDLNFSFICCFF